jgi:hypothetical protein
MGFLSCVGYKLEEPYLLTAKGLHQKISHHTFQK